MVENSQIVTIIRDDTFERYNFQTISSFSGQSGSTITTYPTTEGTPHADNIYANPQTLSISVMIGGNENISDEWGIGSDRPANAKALLQYFKDRAIKFTIVTPQGDYSNMFLTSINPNATQTNAYDFSAGLTFTELFISSFEVKKVGPFSDAKITSNDSDSQDNGNNNGQNFSWSAAVNGKYTGDALGISEGIDTAKKWGKEVPIFGHIAGYIIGGNIGAIKGCISWIKNLFS